MKVITIIINTAFAVFVLLFIGGAIWIGSSIMSQIGPYDEVAKCRQYESQGSIPAGSCDCAVRIYPAFHESYDWMDACAIEQARLVKNNN